MENISGFNMGRKIRKTEKSEIGIWGNPGNFGRKLEKLGKRKTLQVPKLTEKKKNLENWRTRENLQKFRVGPEVLD